MRNGQSFLIYPEGTRSPDGRLQPFKKGAVTMAINAGVNIVPVACSNAQRVMRKKSLKIETGEILVEFLEAIDASKYSLAERDQLNRAVHEALAAGLPDDQRPLSPDSSGETAPENVAVLILSKVREITLSRLERDSAARKSYSSPVSGSTRPNSRSS